jgi:hypothetical protein
MREASKSIVVGLAALLLVGAGVEAAHAVCGDLNNNLTVDGGDAVLLSQYLGGGNVVCNGPNPDCNLDGNSPATITPGDLLFMLNVLGGIETLTAPCAGLGPVLPCPTVLTGNINSNVQLAGPCPGSHEIDGTVIIQPGVTLTVQAGAQVDARVTSSNGTDSVLVAVRDAKINAPGTAADPIVFTSDAAVKSAGDWGGVMLNGRAPVNVPGGVGSAEGLPPGQQLFGGNEPNDSSGVFTFVRIEFSGIEFSTDNELNVFTQNGVGRGTLVQNMQANVGFDDCIEWFGGTVQEKFLVASGCRDDLFDWQLGFTGAVQFGLAVQNDGISVGSGRHGFEADNNENGHDFLPRSEPAFCNMTVVGSKGQGSTVDGRSGANLRRGTAGTIANSLIMDWSASCIDFDDNATAAVACDNATTLCTGPGCLRVQDTVCYNNGDPLVAPIAASPVQIVGSAATPCNPTQYYGLLAATEGLLPVSPTALGPAPGGGFSSAYPTSPTTAQYFPANAAPYNNAPDCEAVKPDFFDPADYIGAFDPGNNPGGNWLSSPWISFDVN